MANIKEHTLGKYTLVYNFDALDAAEEKIGALAALMMDPVAASSMKTVRVLLWAGLRFKHKIPIDKIGPIVDEIGIEKVSNAIKTAMEKAYPQSKGDSEGKPKAE